MRWRLGLRPRPRWGSLRRSPKPPSRDGLRAFGARNSLFLSPSYSSGPNLSPQFNIPRIANGSKQPLNPTPSTLCASFLDRRDLNCMGPLAMFSLSCTRARAHDFSTSAHSLYLLAYVKHRSRMLLAHEAGQCAHGKIKLEGTLPLSYFLVIRPLVHRLYSIN